MEEKLTKKILADPEVLAAYLKDPESEKTEKLMISKLIAAIKKDSVLMNSLANEIFGKEIKFTDAEKTTLMNIILNHP